MLYLWFSHVCSHVWRCLHRLRVRCGKCLWIFDELVTRGSGILPDTGIQLAKHYGSYGLLLRFNRIFVDVYGCCNFNQRDFYGEKAQNGGNLYPRVVSQAAGDFVDSWFCLMTL